MKKFERLKFYRECQKFGQKEFYERFAVTQSNASKYESGTVSLPDELEAELAADGLNLHWLTTGKGEMQFKEEEFRIPLLTREQTLTFDHAAEIPERKANSGDYPDTSTVPVPRRILEYSTDLRAIEVFDSRMAPILRSGDIAIFEATGWGGDGICLYRMNGVLHLSFAKWEKPNGPYILWNLLKGGINYDAASFKAIGRVRAVVGDLFAFDLPDSIGPLETRLSGLESKWANLENDSYIAEPETKYSNCATVTQLEEDSYTAEEEPVYGEAVEAVSYHEDIAAGPPIEQSEDESQVVDVPGRYIRTKPGDYYVLRIRGNSMIDALIPDGSMALIRKSDAPQDGKIQVVRLDERATLKRLREGEDNRWTLCYEDGSGRTIPMGIENQVQGDFIAVLPPSTRPRMRGE